MTEGKVGKGEPAGKAEGAEIRNDASEETGIPSTLEESNPYP